MLMLLVLLIIWSEVVYCAYSTWSETTAPVSYDYDVLTCDSSCQYIVAGSYYNSVYISNNSGSSWTEITSLPTSNNWSGGTADATGQYWIIADNDGYT